MNLVSTLRRLYLLLILLVAGVSHAVAQTENPCASPNDKLPASFYEVPPGPPGTWRASISLDRLQENDSLVPVAVTSVGSIQGPADRRGLRLGCGILINRSQKSVTSVRLRWILVRNQDRSLITREGYTRETVLAEGHTPAIELRIPTKSFVRTDFSIISFATVTRNLVRQGTLSGDYLLLIGVYEVLLEDGSVWNAGPVVK